MSEALANAGQLEEAITTIQRARSANREAYYALPSMLGGRASCMCASRHGEAFEAFLAFDADYTIPEGESRGGHLARVLSWLEQIAKSGAARVLAITHGGTIDFLYRMAMAQPIHGGDEIFAGSNATLFRFEVGYPALRLITFAASLESPIA